MAEVKCYDLNGEEVGLLSVDDAIFGDKVRYRLLKEVVVAYERGGRQGTACTKTRGEVAGSGRKPWIQKGTGRARAGDRRSPIWVGGGTVFGPRPRDYGVRVPAKKRFQALKSALKVKLQEGEIKIVKTLDIPEPKTKILRRLLENAGCTGGVLLVLSEKKENVWLAARNLPRVDVYTYDHLDARKVLLRKDVLIEESAFEKIKERMGDGKDE